MTKTLNPPNQGSGGHAFVVSQDMAPKPPLEEIWLRAWTATANTFNSKPVDCTKYADACVRDFLERFDDSGLRAR